MIVMSNCTFKAEGSLILLVISSGDKLHGLYEMDQFNRFKMK